jgi:hypothetical protein
MAKISIKDVSADPATLLFYLPSFKIKLFIGLSSSKENRGNFVQSY